MRRLALAAASTLLLLAACDRTPKAPPVPTEAEMQKSLDAAKTFMAENAKQPGVMALPSGVQYKIVKTGAKDGISPKPEDEVRVHYEGKLVNGEIFDSSYKSGQPVVFVLGNLIPAWVEAMQQMKPGDEWELWVPPEQGYGDSQTGPIPPNSVLIFRIELLGVLPAGGTTGNG
jgi:peptidylprolyl isomerase/FKBP-type peptidyl-prolyl cis-trans isomerase FklB